MSTANAPGLHACTAAEYHSDRARVSQSMLKDLRKNAQRFHGRYIAGTIPEREQTPPMLLGNVTDIYTLSAPLADKLIAVAPRVAPDGEPWDRRKRAHKEDWAEWLDSANGKLQIDAATNDKAQAMRDAAWSHPQAKEWLAAAEATQQALRWEAKQQALRWEEVASGPINCKALLDMIVPSAGIGGRRLIVDLKTARDSSPEAFAWACYDYGYHIQQAFYQDGYLAATDESTDFAFIVVESEAPYTVACYDLREADVEQGREEYREALRELVRRRAENDWLPPHSKQITTIALPRKAQYAKEYQT